MSRYIDAEWLIKESMPLSFSVQKWVNEVQIMTAPSIDIVRCKECRHYENEAYQDGYGYCKNHMSVLEDGDFCSRGERREP